MDQFTDHSGFVFTDAIHGRRHQANLPGNEGTIGPATTAHPRSGPPDARSSFPPLTDTTLRSQYATRTLHEAAQPIFEIRREDWAQTTTARVPPYSHTKRVSSIKFNGEPYV